MTTVLDMNPSETLAKADSVLPRFDWDDESKRKYLSYRLCGFSRREAKDFSGVSERTIYNWRQKDTEFESIEATNLLTLQRSFSEQVINLDFTRNFKLALELDSVILTKAHKASSDPNAEQLTTTERTYLNKIRPLYTPQAYAALQDMFAGLDKISGWDEILAQKSPDGSISIAARKHG